jgi:hypothetical protein
MLDYRLAVSRFRSPFQCIDDLAARMLNRLRDHCEQITPPLAPHTLAGAEIPLLLTAEGIRNALHIREVVRGRVEFRLNDLGAAPAGLFRRIGSCL